jgi:hypothetical protein
LTCFILHSNLPLGQSEECISKLFRALCMSVILTGCSSIPDVQYNYYFAKSETSVTVAQAISCDASRTNLIVTSTSSGPTMAYSADTASMHSINVRDIEGEFHTFVDSDATFGFYDDGRLKTINQNTTGQGEAVIKSAVSLATTAIPLFAGFRAEAVAPPETDACKIIDTWGGRNVKAGSVNLSYSTQFDITHVLGKSFTAPPSAASKQLYDMRGHGCSRSRTFTEVRSEQTHHGRHYYGRQSRYVSGGRRLPYT